MSDLIEGFSGILDTDEWFEWLKITKSFVYRGKDAVFKVWQTNLGVWRVDKYVKGRTWQLHIGVTSKCTLAKLREIEKKIVAIDEQMQQEIDMQHVLPIMRTGEHKYEYAVRALREIIQAIKEERKGYKQNYFAYGIQDLKKLGELING